MLNKIFSENKIKNLASVELVLLLGVLLVFVFEIGGDTGVIWVGDLFSFFSALLVTVFCFLLWRSFSPNEVSKKIWGALALGFSLWTLGEFLWGFYELVLQTEIPYPSLADVAWILGYIPLIYAVYTRYKSFMVPLDSGQWIRLLVVYLIIVIIIFFGLLLPIVSCPDYESPLIQILDVLYPLGDLITFFFILMIFSVLRGGQMSQSWLIIAVGMLILILSDSMFSYGYWNEIYFPEDGINAFTIGTNISYYASYLIIGLGVYSEMKTHKIS